uniref:DNA2/NAM7 helicase-like C-terminal domain-containing protein n=1 Tax=Romanomermis culicivorax TaxID=13658 RepID=A0A915I5C4_ROMCU
MISRFPIAWVNVTRQESLEDNSPSIQNIQEATAIVNLMASLMGLQMFKNEDIIIITSYSAQYFNYRCIADWCTVNPNGMYEQLPHERLWPCIGAIESEEQQLVVQKIMASTNAITISIHEHFIKEFRILSLPAFINTCHNRLHHELNQPSKNPITKQECNIKGLTTVLSDVQHYIDVIRDY